MMDQGKLEKALKHLELQYANYQHAQNRPELTVIDREAIAESSVSTPTADDIKRAIITLHQIAELADRLDRHCYHTHSPFIEGLCETESVVDELDHLREAINRIGWMADVGHQRLQGYPAVKESAEAWMLPPSFAWSAAVPE